MKKHLIIILWMTFVLPGLTGHLAGAQENPWTLQDCIGYALDHNLSVQRSALQVLQREVDVNTAENNRLPGVHGSASQNFSFDSGNTPTYGKDNASLRSEGWIAADGVLAPEHDAAHVHWGGAWRMPTMDELSALDSNCDWTWTTRNGLNGYLVRGRGDYASASIFFPAAGYGNGTSLYYPVSYGNYWSAVPLSSYSYDAWYLDFDWRYHNTDYLRYYGRSVRPVQGVAE